MGKKKQKKDVVEVVEVQKQTNGEAEVVPTTYTFTRTTSGRRAKGEVERAVGLAKDAGNEKPKDVITWIKDHFGEELNPAHVAAVLGGGNREEKKTERLKIIKDEVLEEDIEGCLRFFKQLSVIAEKVGGYDNLHNLLSEQVEMEEADNLVGEIQADQAGALAKLLEKHGLEVALRLLQSKQNGG